MGDVLQQVLLQHVVERTRRQVSLFQRARVHPDPEPVAGVPGAERRELDALDLPAGKRREGRQQEAEGAADLQETPRRREPPELAGEKEGVAVVTLPLAGVLREAVRGARVEVFAAVEGGERGGREPRTNLPEAAPAATVNPDRSDARHPGLDQRSHPARSAADVAGVGVGHGGA